MLLSGIDLHTKISSVFPGKSQREIAEILEVSEQLVGGWKKNKSLPTLLTLEKASKISGFPISYFLNKQPEASTQSPDQIEAMNLFPKLLSQLAEWHNDALRNPELLKAWLDVLRAVGEMCEAKRKTG